MEQDRGWGAWACLALAVGQPRPCLRWVLTLRLPRGSRGAPPARPCCGGCVDPGTGAPLLSGWHWGLRLPGCVMAMLLSVFSGCLGGSRWHPTLRSRGADKESLAVGYSLLLLATVVPGRGCQPPPPCPARLCQGRRQQILLHLGWTGQSQDPSLGHLERCDWAGSVSRRDVTARPRQRWLGLAVPQALGLPLGRNVPF